MFYESNSNHIRIWIEGYFFINNDMFIKVSVYYRILHSDRVKTFKIILHIEQIISQNYVVWIYRFDMRKKSQMCIRSIASTVCGFWRQWEKERERIQQQPLWCEHQTTICFSTATDARHCNGPQDAEISSE